MPPGFDFPSETELWLPLAPVAALRTLFEQRGSYWLSVVGRLRDGVSPEVVEVRLNTILGRLLRP